MQRLPLFFGGLAFAIAAAASFLVASLLNDYVEHATAKTVNSALNEGGYTWSLVRADGLKVHVSGASPDEASRFNALAAVKKVVNSTRVQDAIKVVDPDDLSPPKFSLELLRNDDGISLIGLIPDKSDRSDVLGSIVDIAEDTTVTDMLETADYAEPEGWNEALEFALSSLRSLPRSKISVTPMRVTITAITESQEEKQRIEALLEKGRPENIELTMHISAPRPVITPFSLRLTKDTNGAHFDSCSANSKPARAKILAAAVEAGVLAEDATIEACTIGLGAPTPRWTEGVVLAIQALNELGGGDLTFSDADITLVATVETKQIDFDRIVHNLEQALPDVFSVHAVLPPKPNVEGEGVKIEPPEFLATKSPEGLVQMRGRLRDERTKLAISNFARAQFGGDNVHDTTRTDDAMPDGWPQRVLAGLQALGKLHHGLLVVQEDTLELSGISDRAEATTEITQLLSETLGDASRFTIDVTFEQALSLVDTRPSGEECVETINAILTEEQIVFATSSTKIDSSAIDVVERIAEAMEKCTEVPMEIGGHTDSQGRESMNQALSQARAEAVLDTLLSFEVLTSFLSAKGYGESQPIADNDTDEGRAANRRIEFTLLAADTEADADASEDTVERATDGDETDGETADGQN